MRFSWNVVGHYFTTRRFSRSGRDVELTVLAMPGVSCWDDDPVMVWSTNPCFCRPWLTLVLSRNAGIGSALCGTHRDLTRDLIGILHAHRFVHFNLRASGFTPFCSVGGLG